MKMTAVEKSSAEEPKERVPENNEEDEWAHPVGNPLDEVPTELVTSVESHRRTKIRTGVDVTELSGSESSKPFNPAMEQTLLKNQEMLSKRASSEAAGKGSVIEMVVPRTVFIFKKLRPKKLIIWSSKPLRFPLSQINDNNTNAALRCFECS